MSDFSFKNKKFPLKLAPTFLLAASVSFLMSFSSIILISTNEGEEECQFFAQSGSFRTFSAASSQLEELKKIGYSPVIENVTSQNGFNYKVIVGPFANRSQTNNARENLRRLNMDSLEIKSCIKLTDEST
jgi:cell division protein FtsN